MGLLSELYQLKPGQWFTLSSTENPDNYQAIARDLYEPNRFFLVFENHYEVFVGPSVSFIDNCGNICRVERGMFNGCSLMPGTTLSIYNTFEMSAIKGRAEIERAYEIAIQHFDRAHEQLVTRANANANTNRLHQNFIEVLCRRITEQSQFLKLQLRDFKDSILLRAQLIRKTAEFFSSEQLQQLPIPPSLINDVEAFRKR